MSLSWPGNVCLHWPSRMSHNLADASHAPDTNARQCGDNDSAITSPVWPINEVTCWPVSMSHRPQDISPELVTICIRVRAEGESEKKNKNKKNTFYNCLFVYMNGKMHVCVCVCVGADLIVIQKSTARQIAGVSGQFTWYTNVALSSFQTVNRTNVIESATGYITTRWCVRTRHNPWWTQWNCMNL